MNTAKLKSKKVLVTGGSGFFPSHLVKRLHAIGCELFVVSKYNSIVDNVRLAALWDDIHCIEADLRNLDALKQINDIKPQYVFHCAAYNHVGDSFLQVQESLNANSLGTANLMECYRGYERFVYISSSEVYGLQTQVPFTESETPFPTSPYAVGKYSGELYAQMHRHVYNLPVVVLRPFNTFGPYQSPRAVIAEIIIKCLRGETIKTTEGKQTRDFNYVENMVDGILMAATHDKVHPETINLGSGEEITIREFVQKVHQLTGSKSKLEIGALPYRPTEIWRMSADNRKAAALLGWKPQVSFEEGLKRTVEWYRKFLDVYTNPKSSLLQL